MQCPRCHRELSDGYSSCPRCGSPIGGGTSRPPRRTSSGSSPVPPTSGKATSRPASKRRSPLARLALILVLSFFGSALVVGGYYYVKIRPRVKLMEDPYWGSEPSKKKSALQAFVWVGNGNTIVGQLHETDGFPWFRENFGRLPESHAFWHCCTSTGVGRQVTRTAEAQRLALAKTTASEGLPPLLGPPPQGGGGKALSASL